MSYRVPSWARTLALVAALSAMLTAPFMVLSYVAQHDTDSARERRIASAYGPQARQPRGQTGGYPRQASDSSVDEADEEDFGCWQLQASRTKPVSLNAIWREDCPVKGRPTLAPGTHPLPFKAVYLSAWGSGLPNLRKAKTHVAFSEDLSDTEDTRAGMLFLPSSRQGDGYIVAGWTQKNGPGSQASGMHISVAPAAPTCLETTAGGVFLSTQNPYSSTSGLGAESWMADCDHPK